MPVLENFKNIPRSPYGGGATGLKCNFFLLQICNKVPGGKKEGACRPPTGDRPLSPTPGATGQWAPPAGDRGGCRPPTGNRVRPPI